MLWLVMIVMTTTMAMTLTSFNLHFCWTMGSCRLSDTVPERQTRGNTGRAFESLALWGFGGHLWILHQMQIIANLCPLQRTIGKNGKRQWQGTKALKGTQCFDCR